MTKPLPFTESAVRRAVNAARKAGLQVGGVRIDPNGTITILDQSLAPPAIPMQDDKEADNWANAC